MRIDHIIQSLRVLAKADAMIAEAAFKERLPKWVDGRLFLFFDLHCPSLKGDVHEEASFLEPEGRDQAARLDKFSSYLERDQQGHILYAKSHNFRFGFGYNHYADTVPPLLASGWVRTLPGNLLSVAAEIAFANAGGSVVDSNSAEELGRDIAVAVKDYLKDKPTLEDKPELPPSPAPAPAAKK